MCTQVGRSEQSNNNKKHGKKTQIVCGERFGQMRMLLCCVQTTLSDKNNINQPIDVSTKTNGTQGGAKFGLRPD